MAPLSDVRRGVRGRRGCAPFPRRIALRLPLERPVARGRPLEPRRKLETAGRRCRRLCLWSVDVQSTHVTAIVLTEGVVIPLLDGSITVMLTVVVALLVVVRRAR